MISPARLLRLYEAGGVTRHEMLLRLCQMATERHPAELIAELPADAVAELRNEVAVPPETQDGCRVIAAICATPDFDAEQFYREQSRRLFEGIWLWHRHFERFPEK